MKCIRRCRFVTDRSFFFCCLFSFFIFPILISMCHVQCNAFTWFSMKFCIEQLFIDCALHFFSLLSLSFSRLWNCMLYVKLFFYEKEIKKLFGWCKRSKFHWTFSLWKCVLVQEKENNYLTLYCHLIDLQTKCFKLVVWKLFNVLAF